MGWANCGTNTAYAHGPEQGSRGCRGPRCLVAKREYSRRWRDAGGREYQRAWAEGRKPAEASPEVIEKWKEWLRR